MIEVDRPRRGLIAPLFDGIEDSMVKAYLQGYMGDAYVRRFDNPSAALIVSGEYSFWGGDPESADAVYLVEHFFDACAADASVGIFADDRPGWIRTLMSHSANHPEKVPRFGIAQKDYAFDRNLLEGCINTIPANFALVPFDEALYHETLRHDWSKEFCETFANAEDYMKRGFGFAVLKDGEPVSGASTMTVYDGGCEVQVATHDAYRQRGLALVCSAALVLECARRGVRPCWDAANLASKKLALKLGYEYRGEYTTVRMSK